VALESMRLPLRQHRFDYRISNEGDISSRLLKEVSYCKGGPRSDTGGRPDMEAEPYSRI
jgi:hypothetical protein